MVRYAVTMMLAALPLAGVATATPGQRAAAARAVVDGYYRAIDRGDFRTAYRSWGGRGQASGKSYAAFVRGFAGTADTRVITGRPGDVEGAAGSLYVDVPVDVHARLKNGQRQHFSGTYTLRRVNGVDGATPDQLRWRIASAKLRAVR